ncbi:cbb3-type cytochrome c oxidase subunit I [Marinirhabdus gelatinilytica]|uniref:Cytochrome c oxidase cbb3-type subunit 1 n=1 Tax=Marinirhabdus gelatinilytica TaxID=1703343 RepID=A0A370QLD7_9FLAO|nr:cbb3-type cytochrome c oxidase subunit I [Marinirhabdus gelatinilytica]RDK89185.1 cytochrome c oxidase cbb3-type subunit 1 [Marinirhabdus gelatinilytica]
MKNTLSFIIQTTEVTTENWLSSPGVIGTIVLIFIVVFLGLFIFIKRLNIYADLLTKNTKDLTEEEFERRLVNLDKEEVDKILELRRQGFQVTQKQAELTKISSKNSGFIKKIINPKNPLFDEKARSTIKIKISEELKQIVIWYIGASAFWLIFGTLVGQYLGMKFIWPEMDTSSWLSFGRLRPVHTNTVFWGWASLAMIGLGHYVICRTSNREIVSYAWSKIAFWLINLSVFLGNLFLMAGVNNGGGEYREYIWPIMALFAIGIIITFFNFYKTVAMRKISEIYISNWFILASLVWTIILTIIGYFPSYQDGLGETVIQGYYMHQGVGMWFMTFTLGLVYYFLPSSLNKPIYSYSLGVLAFWTQMLFYTLIGTHHFVFSPLPWWLQTVAIVFSAGMFIPVFAGTTNFLMTMRGSWNHISKSYVLPFFLVGVVFYFVGSVQGSFQAFRFTNYLWHFTDFNVAHSHMTMYGIITFLMWACVYALLPKITGKEPPQYLVGSHFWLAFIGLIAYMVSLMAGGTLKGLSWIEGNPFIESVILMENYWVWRAVGGSLMFISHLIFGYNFYLMIRKKKPVGTLLRNYSQSEL